MAVVVDTNVLMTASLKADASVGCVESCVRELLAIRSNGRQVVLDLQGTILQEYLQNLSLGGRQGAGNAFVKWVWDNQGNPEYCVKVSITPTPEDPRDFVEFPHLPELEKFDLDDRKFVAVARVHRPSPPILQATDTKWVGWAPALERAGVRVVFLCEGEIRARFARKFGQPDETGRG
jgi:hypothetical protein